MEQNYNDKGRASHYNTQRIETMFLFEQTYGTVACMLFCEMNAMKYRLRMGHKDQPVEQELKKIGWYERAAQFYYDKIDTEDEVIRTARARLISFTE